MWSDNAVGLTLAISSSLFIGSSFIIKKRGLRVAGNTGLRAGAGGYSYLCEPLWWAGMSFMIIGEIANFAAYAFAPATLVTPLGALSIIISAVLAHWVLKERLNLFGMVGCALCINGSVTIVLHTPAERPIESVLEVWNMVFQPGFLLYSITALVIILYLVWGVTPEVATSNIFVYIGICSLAGSLSVMSCKALGVALKLTFQGDNQLIYVNTYVFMLVVASCIVTQMNYLNKALDLFNTAIVSPIYYVMFTLLTITASNIMFQDMQTTVQIITTLCGFTTIVAGTFLLHTTRNMDLTVSDLDELTRGQTSPATGSGASMASGPTAGALQKRRGVSTAVVELLASGGRKQDAYGNSKEGGHEGLENDREDEPLLPVSSNVVNMSSSTLRSKAQGSKSAAAL